MARKKWEYLFYRPISRETDERWLDGDGRDLPYSYKGFKDAGLDGWELALHTAQTDEDYERFIFKREVEQQ